MGKQHLRMFFGLSRHLCIGIVFKTRLNYSEISIKLQVFFALTMAATGISQSGSFAPDKSKASTATTSIFSILDRKSKIDPCDESGMTLDNVKGNIELRNIDFTYPTRPDVQIFRDLNLKIHSGKVCLSFLISISLDFQ